jgi:carboxyl-terminal processing protease
LHVIIHQREEAFKNRTPTMLMSTMKNITTVLKMVSYIIRDSIQFSDSLKFTTPGGKTVYGGGGIMPDVFVPVDTTRLSKYLSAVFSKGLVNQFAFDYADKNRGSLAAYKSFESFNKQFLISEKMYSDFVLYAENKGVKKDEYGVRVSADYIKLQIKAIIARNIWNDEGLLSRNFK